MLRQAEGLYTNLYFQNDGKDYSFAYKLSPLTTI